MNDFEIEDLLPFDGEKDLEVDMQGFDLLLPDDIWSQSSHELVFNFDSEVVEIQKGPDFLDSQEQQPKASDHKSTDDEKELLPFQNLSPDSILHCERSNSPKALLTSDPDLDFKRKRARNKHALPLANNPQFAFTSPSSSSKLDDHLYEKSWRMKQKKEKKKKKLLDFVSDSQEATEKECSYCKSRSTPRWREGPYGPKSLCNACGMRYRKSLHLQYLQDFVSDSQEATEKKCSHCKSTSTPQWREGPHGPRTLCNACGMRYRKGLLLPEYRPASSPTFVPSLHSNSHKKVLQIRRKRSFALGTYSS